jgi:hypothetical protein
MIKGRAFGCRACAFRACGVRLGAMGCGLWTACGRDALPCLRPSASSLVLPVLPCVPPCFHVRAHVCVYTCIRVSPASRRHARIRSRVCVGGWVHWWKWRGQVYALMTHTLRLHNCQDVAPETQARDDEEGTEMMPPGAGASAVAGQVEVGANSEAPGVEGGGGGAETAEARAPSATSGGGHREVTA